jgi:hypothetical protein
MVRFAEICVAKGVVPAIQNPILEHNAATEGLNPRNIGFGAAGGD